MNICRKKTRKEKYKKKCNILILTLIESTMTMKWQMTLTMNDDVEPGPYLFSVNTNYLLIAIYFESFRLYYYSISLFILTRKKNRRTFDFCIGGLDH